MKRNLVRDSFVVSVRVSPRGGRNAVIGVRADGVLLVRVAAPPVDGAANHALIELVAETFAVRRGCVTLLSGETGRDKRLEIAGLTQEQGSTTLRALPVLVDSDTR